MPPPRGDKRRMFLTFFTELRAAKVPVTLREYLALMGALERDLAEKRVDEALYDAKRNGRNRIASWAAPKPHPQQLVLAT